MIQNHIEALAMIPNEIITMLEKNNLAIRSKIKQTHHVQAKHRPEVN